MRTVNVAPTYATLAGIVIRDIEFSDLTTKKLAIGLLEEMADKLDSLNELSKEENHIKLVDGKVEVLNHV